MNVGMPDSRSRASSSGLPGVSAQPRGLVTKTWIISAPTSAAYARPPLASPPVTGTCAPMMGFLLVMMGSAYAVRRLELSTNDGPGGASGCEVALLDREPSEK